MAFLKDFQRMDMWMKVLLGLAIFVLVWALFWPRPGSYVQLVPVDIPGSSAHLYAAKLEHMEPFDGGNPAFTMFYAPWCGYCKKAMPEWDQLQSNYNKVSVMKVNCDENKELGKLHGVQSYPTIKFLPNGINNPQGAREYQGARTASDMAAYLDQHVSADPSVMLNEAAPVPGGPPTPGYRAGQGPLTTSYVARNMGLS